MKKLFIIVNVDSFFLSHRKEIALRAKEEGFDVTIVANDTGKGDMIRSLGLNYINLPIKKAGLNPLDEVKTFYFLYRLFRRERPDIVHAVGMKTILWGGIAARMVSVKGFVSAVSGLGVIFSPEFNRGLRRVISHSVLSVMRFIHKRRGVFSIFHNMEDLEMFVSKGIISREKAIRTMGSGISLEEYGYQPEPPVDVTDGGKIRVLFTARMVEDKGVLTLVEAANILREQFSGSVEFLLCGGVDTNPLAISADQLNALCDGVYIKWLGRRDDVHRLLGESHIFAFPSYYKEGLPKSCIEAAAVGRPIVTCDSTGCRDTVIDGVTGYLIPVKDSEALAKKLQLLFEDGELRRKMGEEARAFAERNFSIETVIGIHLDIYNQL